MVLPVVGERLVEGSVLLGGDVLRVTGPQGLGLVKNLLLLGLLLDLLCLLLHSTEEMAVSIAPSLPGITARDKAAYLLLGFILDLLDLGLLLLLIFLLLLLLLVLDLLLYLLLNDKLDRVADELGVLLDDVLDPLLLEVLDLVLLQVQSELGTTSKRWVDGILGDGVGLRGLGFPNVLFVIVVLGDDLDLVGDEVGGVETDTELTDHAADVVTREKKTLNRPTHHRTEQLT